MSIYSKLSALLTAANTTTGESDTTLTDAVQTLIDGYGQGGGGDPLFHEKVGDGNAYIYLYLPTAKHLDVTLNAGGRNASFSIDWGDGSQVETKTGVTSNLHTYQDPGYYTIKLVALSGDPCFGAGGGNNWILGGGGYPGRVKQSALIGCEVGEWTYSGYELFMSSNCAFLYAKEGKTSGNAPQARECRLLHILEISENATKIQSYCYSGCFNLREVVIPSNIQTIEGSSFSSVSAEFHLKPTTPPTLTSASAFSTNCNPTFYVPYSSDHSVLNAYKTATNWSTFVDSIFEEPEE